MNGATMNVQVLASKDTAGRIASLLRENERLLVENKRLNSELRLLHYKFRGENKRIRSGSSFGQVVLTICVVAALLLILYGMGYVEIPSLLSAINDYPVVENPQ